MGNLELNKKRDIPHATSLDYITAEIRMANTDENNDEVVMEEFELVDDFDNEWSLQSIIDQLTENNVTSYLIRWLAVCVWEKTWEPERLIDCRKKWSNTKSGGCDANKLNARTRFAFHLDQGRPHSQ